MYRIPLATAGFVCSDYENLGFIINLKYIGDEVALLVGTDLRRKLRIIMRVVK